MDSHDVAINEDAASFLFQFLRDRQDESRSLTARSTARTSLATLSSTNELYQILRELSNPEPHSSIQLPRKNCRSSHRSRHSQNSALHHSSPQYARQVTSTEKSLNLISEGLKSGLQRLEAYQTSSKGSSNRSSNRQEVPRLETSYIDDLQELMSAVQVELLKTKTEMELQIVRDSRNAVPNRATDAAPVPKRHKSVSCSAIKEDHAVGNFNNANPSPQHFFRPIHAPPPSNYLCHSCFIPGHYIQNCPNTSHKLLDGNNATSQFSETSSTSSYDRYPHPYQSQYGSYSPHMNYSPYAQNYSAFQPYPPSNQQQGSSDHCPPPQQHDRRRNKSTSANLTPYQGVKRCFGEFKCQKCKRKWMSANSWANHSQMCIKCKLPIFPFKQRPLEDNKIK